MAIREEQFHHQGAIPCNRDAGGEWRNVNESFRGLRASLGDLNSRRLQLAEHRVLGYPECCVELLRGRGRQVAEERRDHRQRDAGVEEPGRDRVSEGSGRDGGIKAIG